MKIDLDGAIHIKSGQFKNSPSYIENKSRAQIQDELSSHVWQLHGRNGRT